jgi:hypothetical protein
VAETVTWATWLPAESWFPKSPTPKDRDPGVVPLTMFVLLTTSQGRSPGAYGALLARSLVVNAIGVAEPPELVTVTVCPRVLTS